ncbi:MAG: RNA 2',3'-cyclic phosphodiesterase [Thermoanaerobaculia bacterium]|nr:RNA 2',3'-cyclic phosphodiesterase [Thermoanaerobaculia bacterium]
MRLFVAYRIGAESAARVAAVVSSIRTRLPRASWVGRDAYHLTFAFLGEHDPEVVPRVSAALKAATAGLAPVEARLTGGGFFPDERRPRVGWIAVEPHAPVIAVAASVRSSIAACGIRFDEKPFKAHLTLVRIRDEWKARDAALFAEAIDAAGRIPFELDRVSLFESRLLPSGAVHTELAHAALQ